MFTPNDFKELAEKLISQLLSFKPYQEAVIRTSISRTYYYIFLELRETIYINLLKEDKEKFISHENHHILIQKLLFEIGKEKNDTKYIKASKTLKGLRRARNKADYNIIEGQSKENYEIIKPDLPFLEDIARSIPTISRETLSKCLDNAIKNTA